MSSRLLVVTLFLVACGKGTKDQTPSTTEPKVQETPGAPGNPAVAKVDRPKTEPVKAASRGPERVVYSLIDNRLSAHLTRGNGLVLPAGSAAFAKYTRFANVTTGKAKKTWDLRQVDGDVKVGVMN